MPSPINRMPGVPVDLTPSTSPPFRPNTGPRTPRTAPATSPGSSSPDQTSQGIYSMSALDLPAS